VDRVSGGVGNVERLDMMYEMLRILLMVKETWRELVMVVERLAMMYEMLRRKRWEYS